jgi:hypothetical protein
MREPLLGRSQADFLVLKDQTHLIIETQLVLSKIKDIYYIIFFRFGFGRPPTGANAGAQNRNSSAH